MKRPKQTDSHLRHEILGISFLAAGLLGIVCLLYPSTGTVSFYIERVLKMLTGEGRYLFPLLMAFWGIKLIKGANLGATNRTWGGSILFFVAITLLHIFMAGESGWSGGLAGSGGGILGAALYLLFYKSFGLAGTIIILTALALIGFLLCANAPLYTVASGFAASLSGYARRVGTSVSNFMFIEDPGEKDETPVIIDHAHSGGEDMSRPSGVHREEDPAGAGAFESAAGAGNGPLLRLVKPGEYGLESLSGGDEHVKSDDRPRWQGDYKPPPLSLLARPPRGRNLRSSKDISENVKILEETLENFGVKAKVTQVSRGPAITRYEIQPPPGIKVSRIVGLADDIALSMASPDVRIEAPIPGKAAVGIEVPNVEITMVHLRELLETEEFRAAASKLTVVLGKDIAGTPVVADLTRMPHLLIAGATGSGKSVCLNTMLSGILFKALPDEVKFLIIDPKMVELTTYNGIPHLISPVVTDPKKAATALRWAVKEMEYRYELFASAGVRDITRYNKKDGVRPLPFIVIIIDELADLMMVAPADVEDSICRLAQMARAAGMHLVIATQRPSVDVITGLIKANIPTRIAFQVSSRIDSRTILDQQGAESLLGQGDMLYLPPGHGVPSRVHGAFVSDDEVHRVTGFLREIGPPQYDESVLEEPDTGEGEGGGEGGDAEADPLYDEAVALVLKTRRPSISAVQRHLRIGYNRAARLIEAMEKAGLVSPMQSNGNREVIAPNRGE